MSALILVADTENGLLYACADPTARFTESAVSDWRLSAVLKPFRSVEDAREALTAAGGADVRELDGGNRGKTKRAGKGA